LSAVDIIKTKRTVFILIKEGKMRLTRGGEYGIRGMLYLAMQPGESVTLLSEISTAQRIPESYLAKIFQTLTKAGLVRSHRGFKGGYSLARSAGDITIKDIIEGVEGPIALNQCSQEVSKCAEENRCKIQNVWKDAQNAMVGVLDGTTLADLVTETLAGQS
jgi:Rrf2 family iron-sulfur cluster assembly transcriptional regulator